MLETMGTLAAGDLPPVIDVEVGEGASSATIVNGVRRWLERVEAATGVRPIVYTSWGFWSRYPLWVANYGVQCPEAPWRRARPLLVPCASMLRCAVQVLRAATVYSELCRGT